jgi:isopenicillin N synthase-like dioxygenase
VELPAIDLTRLERAGGSEQMRLGAVVRELGAFRLTGHGVDVRVSDGLLAESRRFFELPQPERNAIDMIHSPYFRGYSAAGSERTLGEPDLREQLDVGCISCAVSQRASWLRSSSRSACLATPLPPVFRDSRTSD